MKQLFVILFIFLFVSTSFGQRGGIDIRRGGGGVTATNSPGNGIPPLFLTAVTNADGTITYFFAAPSATATNAQPPSAVLSNLVGTVGSNVTNVHANVGVVVNGIHYRPGTDITTNIYNQGNLTNYGVFRQGNDAYFSNGIHVVSGLNVAGSGGITSTIVRITGSGGLTLLDLADAPVLGVDSGGLVVSRLGVVRGIKTNGTIVGFQTNINFIYGTNMVITATNNSTTGSVDIYISAVDSGAGGGITGGNANQFTTSGTILNIMSGSSQTNTITYSPTNYMPNLTRMPFWKVDVSGRVALFNTNGTTELLQFRNDADPDIGLYILPGQNQYFVSLNALDDPNSRFTMVFGDNYTHRWWRRALQYIDAVSGTENYVYAFDTNANMTIGTNTRTLTLYGSTVTAFGDFNLDNQILWNGSDLTLTSPIVQDSLTVNGSYNSEVETITGTIIDAATSPVKYKLLSGNTTMTLSNLAVGRFVTLIVSNPASHTFSISGAGVYLNQNTTPEVTTNGITEYMIFRPLTSLTNIKVSGRELELAFGPNIKSETNSTGTLLSILTTDSINVHSNLTVTNAMRWLTADIFPTSQATNFNVSFTNTARTINMTNDVWFSAVSDVPGANVGQGVAIVIRNFSGSTFRLGCSASFDRSGTNNVAVPNNAHAVAHFMPNGTGSSELTNILASLRVHDSP